MMQQIALERELRRAKAAQPAPAAGGKAWKVQLQGNPLSFEGIYKANQHLDVGACTTEVCCTRHSCDRVQK